MLHISLLNIPPGVFHVIYYLTLQNIELDVTIDTVPNVKKQHEVNVRMHSVLLSTCTHDRCRTSNEKEECHTTYVFIWTIYFTNVMHMLSYKKTL